mgnify:FL=1
MSNEAILSVAARWKRADAPSKKEVLDMLRDLLTCKAYNAQEKHAIDTAISLLRAADKSQDRSGKSNWLR